MGIMLSDEHGDRFSNVAPMNGRPRLLALDDAFVGMQHHQRRQIALSSKADGIAVPIHLA